MVRDQVRGGPESRNSHLPPIRIFGLYESINVNSGHGYNRGAPDSLRETPGESPGRTGRARRPSLRGSSSIRLIRFRRELNSKSCGGIQSVGLDILGTPAGARWWVASPALFLAPFHPQTRPSCKSTPILVYSLKPIVQRFCPLHGLCRCDTPMVGGSAVR
jgi:hypothetical protein